ncbi:MAG TPA: hypothetical protein VFQ47_09430 [Nitrososphaera sp.]|nr:hypothetical protein [Nitrososphaera sp.]
MRPAAKTILDESGLKDAIINPEVQPVSRKTRTPASIVSDDCPPKKPKTKV